MSRPPSAPEPGESRRDSPEGADAGHATPEHQEPEQGRQVDGADAGHTAEHQAHDLGQQLDAARLRVEARVDAVNKRAGRDLPAAIGVGGGLIAAVVGTLLWWNWGFVLLVAIAITLGSIEVHQALRDHGGMNAAIVPIVVGTVAIVVGSYLAGSRPGVVSSNTVLLAAIGLTVVASLVWRMPKGPDGYVKDAAASLFIIGYLPLMGSFVALMLAGHHGAARIATFILCITSSDIGGYLFGVLWGRHPMAPVISPKKSWEGAAGSVVLATIVGALMGHFVLHAPLWVGVVLGVTMVLFGTVGDLIESLIKRDMGLKDMSSFLPGHGGVMDRIDSMVIGAPAAWLVMYLLVPGG